MEDDRKWDYSPFLTSFLPRGWDGVQDKDTGYPDTVKRHRDVPPNEDRRFGLRVCEPFLPRDSKTTLSVHKRTRRSVSSEPGTEVWDGKG